MRQQGQEMAPGSCQHIRTPVLGHRQVTHTFLENCVQRWGNSWQEAATLTKHGSSLPWPLAPRDICQTQGMSVSWTEADLLRHPQLSRASTGRQGAGWAVLVSGEKWKNYQNKGKEGQVGGQATEDGRNSPHSGRVHSCRRIWPQVHPVCRVSFKCSMQMSL